MQRPINFVNHSTQSYYSQTLNIVLSSSSPTGKAKGVKLGGVKALVWPRYYVVS